MKCESRVAGLRFRNPLLLASGTFGLGDRFGRVADALGALVTKAITLEPRAGNPPPRVWEFPGGLLNSVGLENPGLDAFRREVLPGLRRLRANIIVNIAGFTPGEYVELARVLDREPRVNGFELNVSCPNVEQRGLVFGQDPRRLGALVRAVRRATGKFLAVKLTANFTDPARTARACAAAGADAVTVVNTLFGLAVDAERRRPGLGAVTGGISGPALKPFALYCVRHVARQVRLPVIASGGVYSGTDAVEFLLAGARLVEVGSASLARPDAALVILRELVAFGRRRGLRALDELVGGLEEQ